MRACPFFVRTGRATFSILKALDAGLKVLQGGAPLVMNEVHPIR